MEGLAHQLGDAPRIVDLRHPFGDRPEHAAEVDLLEGLALGLVAGDLADQQDERRGILEGGMQPDGGIGGAGAAGDEADAGAARQLAIGLGHVAGAALLPADDEADLVAGLEQRVEGGQIAFPRHAEGHVDPVDPQLIDQDLAAGAAAKRLGHRIPQTSFFS